MLMNENDTKAQWCPFGRGLVQLQDPSGNPIQVTSVNRTTQGRGTTACLGSTCMAWRWAGWKTRLYDTIAPDPHDDNKAGDRLGYCGLAGKPHGAP